MKIIFRVHVHTEAEIQVGHKLGFSGLQGVDAVSATANAEGFTPLTAAARIYGWDRDLITRASQQCNERKEVAIVHQVTPTLLLVPKVTGRTSYKYTVEGCAIDLLMAAKHLKIKSLHFTHFGFMQSHKVADDFRKVLEIILNPLSDLPLEELIWEIDYRGLRALQSAYQSVRLRFHLPDDDPAIILAPQFEWVDTMSLEGGYTWRELVPSPHQHPPTRH
ncbi:MAG: hypothetical protein LW709_10125 [Oxalobacteraceae bacterium]|jgi:hypothetical protein|nr:hypothetical protein [Oxalobacteraceae bacterium]